MIKLLSHNLLEVPICDYDKSYENDIKERLSNYVTLIKREKKDNSLLKDLDIRIIKDINLSIFNAIGKYLDGYPSCAFEIIDSIITKYSEYLKITLDNTKETSMLFRMRKGSNYPFSKKDLFHIPYSLQHIVSAQRYSIAGFPSLYLGSTVFVCWDELGRPNLSEVHISRYMVKTPISILDFGLRPCDIANMLSEEIKNNNHDKLIQNKIIPYLYVWPLIAASSYKVKFQNAPFKPEYIIPQLILQVIKKSNMFDGIRYFSVKGSLGKTDTKFIDDSIYITNYVFPAKERNNKGFCNRLTNMFEMTDPIQWDAVFLSNYKNNDKNSLYKKLTKSIRNSDVKIVSVLGNLHCEYEKTQFGIVESFIVDRLSTEKIVI